uniref:Uncharacterized protein n=1 Tax=Oryza glumipatula TaxID=40148 RepID=A0A0E0ASQ6_9ORYZ
MIFARTTGEAGGSCGAGGRAREISAGGGGVRSERKGGSRCWCVLCRKRAELLVAKKVSLLLSRLV